MERLDRELSDLMAAYRAAVPEPPVSAAFMPRLWERIERNRSFALRLRRMSQYALAAAAAACVMTALLVSPALHKSQTPQGTYLDVLAESQPVETLAPLGIHSSEADH